MIMNWHEPSRPIVEKSHSHGNSNTLSVVGSRNFLSTLMYVGRVLGGGPADGDGGGGESGGAGVPAVARKGLICLTRCAETMMRNVGTSLILIPSASSVIVFLCRDKILALYGRSSSHD